MSRSARVQRTTKESDVLVELDIDGTGVTEIETGVPFFDHMLAQLGQARRLRPRRCAPTGDPDIDAHHTVEDTSLAARPGAARGARRQGRHPPLRRRARAARRGARAGAPSTCPAGPTSCTTEPEIVELIGGYDTTLTRHIFESIVAEAQITLHVGVLAGRNAHHVVEAQFKAFARALRDAVALDPRVVGVPSTKGSL